MFQIPNPPRMLITITKSLFTSTIQFYCCSTIYNIIYSTLVVLVFELELGLALVWAHKNNSCILSTRSTPYQIQKSLANFYFLNSKLITLLLFRSSRYTVLIIFFFHFLFLYYYVLTFCMETKGRKKAQRKKPSATVVVVVANCRGIVSNWIS